MQRHHNLDFLRAFAMVMGIVIHAPILFYIPNIARELEIENIAPAEAWIWIIVSFITNWRMPLFFLLSGFFSMLVLKRRGLLKFISDRIIRIGLTCFLFSTLYDVLDGSLDFTTLHLWFLYELLFFIICFCILNNIKIVRDFLCSKISSKMLFLIFFWLILIAPLALIFNNWWNPLVLSPSETYFDLKIGNFIFYFSYFLVGAILYSNQNLFNLLTRYQNIFFLGAVSIFIFLLHLYISELIMGGGVNLENIAQIRFNPIEVLAYMFFKGLNAIFWCFFLIGLATKFIYSGNTILKWFVELSYPLYLLHFLPILIFSVEFYKAGFSQLNVFFLTVIASFTFSIIIYYIFIKFTPINWVINGYHKSFVKFKFQKIE